MYNKPMQDLFSHLRNLPLSFSSFKYVRACVYAKMNNLCVKRLGAREHRKIRKRVFYRMYVCNNVHM